jgi:hypothetical protein
MDEADNLSQDVDGQPILESDEKYYACNDDYSVDYLTDTAKLVCMNKQCNHEWKPEKPIEWEWIS